MESGFFLFWGSGGSDFWALVLGFWFLLLDVKFEFLCFSQISKFQLVLSTAADSCVCSIVESTWKTVRSPS